MSGNTSYNSRKCARRARGAVAVESALVMSLLITTLFFILEMGLTVVRYNILSAAARAAAREAIVHGSRSSPERTPWGPAEVSGNAGDGSAPALIAAPYLVTLNPADVSLKVTWPDGDNRAGDRVRVSLHYVATPRIPLLDLPSLYDLHAESTMQIVH